MRHLNSIFLFLFILLANAGFGQISVNVTGNTNTTPNLAVSYTSLSAALTDLNAVTAMSGAVVLTCTGGTSETAPATGFTLGSASLNPVLSATNSITINTDGGVVTLNAGVGTTTPGSAAPDGILKLLGADYVEISGLTFTDGNAANPATMEYGLGLFKRVAGDGCNNNLIRNCIFNMQRINNAAGSGPMFDGSVGILVINSTPTAATTSLTPTNGGTLATNGTNSENRFQQNTINGGNIGIGLSGFAATTGVGPTPNAATFLGDLNNQVGTSGRGNTILNFGGGAATSPSAGIRANNQWGVSILDNTIDNNNGGGVNHTTTLRGIFAQAGISANATINNNTVTLQSGGTTSLASAIENVIGSTAASNTVTINSNIIRVAYTTATSGVMNGIISTASAATVNINSNNIQGVSGTNLAGTGTHVMIETGSPTTATANNNTVSNLSRSGASGFWRGIKTTSPTNFTANGNTIENLSWTLVTSTGGIDGIYSFSSAVNVTANNNIIRNLSTPTTGTITGISEFGSSGLKTYQNNQIYNFSTTAGGAGGATFRGISESTGSTNTYSGNLIYSLNSTGTTGGTSGTIVGITFSSGTTNIVTGNAIYDLSSTSTNPLVTGINIGGGTTNNLSNNLIGDLRATASTGNVTISGILSNSASSTTNNIFHNTVNIASTTTSATTFGTSAIYFSQLAPVNNLRNNIFVNTSDPGPTGGFTAAIRYAITPTTTNFPVANNNNFYYAGVPAANRVIYCEGVTATPTNGQQTIANYKTYISVTLPASGRESASVSEVPNWVSTTGSNPINNFLRYNTVIATQIEQGALIGTGISTDFAGTVRCPGGGCPGGALTPDMGAWELNGTLLDLSPPSITYTDLSNVAGGPTSRVTTSFATITDASGVNVTTGTSPRIYYKKSTDPNIWNDNTSATTGWKFVESSSGSSPFDFIIDYTLLNSAPVIAGDVIQYFVVAQDLGVPTVGINSGTFAATPTSVVLTSAAFPIGGSIKSYTILPSISGILTVPGTHPSLTLAGGAFEAINNAVVTGNITIEIDGNLTGENGTISLNEFASPFTVTIKPKTSARSITGSSAGSIIRLNGADRVTIDGSLGSAVNTVCPASAASRDLTITNTNTGTSSAVVWLQTNGVNGATNNNVKNCNLVGNSNTTTLFGLGSGSSSIGLSSLGNGNNNNSFVNNNISKTQYGIYSQGASAGSKNTGNVINQNLINTASPNNVQIGGIMIGFENNITVSGNNISGMNSLTGFSTTDAFGISGNNALLLTSTAGNETTNATITNNVIGSINQNDTGSSAGIYLPAATSGTNLISNNMISGVISTGTSGDGTVGILIGGGTGSTTNIFHNTVVMQGASTSTDRTYALGINGAAPIVSVQNNILISQATGTTLNRVIGLGYTSTTGNYANLVSNNNNFFVSGSSPVIAQTSSLGSGGTVRTSLANWTTETGRDGGGTTINVAPTFVSATDLHLMMGLTSTQLESGGASVGISTDIDCQSRPGPAGSVNGGATAPDIGADEFDGVPAVPMTYVSSTVAQVTGGVFPGVINQEIIRIQVVTSGTLSPLSLTSLDLNANGTSAITDIDATTAKVYYTGASTTFNTATLFGATTPTLATFTVAGTQTLLTGNNYFWLAYDVIASPTGPDLDGECTSITVGTPQTPTVTAPAGNKVIVGPMAGNYNVGSSQTFPNFATLSNAVANLNVRGVSAAVTLTLMDATYNTGSGETFPLNINAIAGASATNTITIRPNTGVAATVIGSASEIIELSGTDYLTIDGLNTGGSSLTFSNTNTGSGTSVVTISSLGAGAGATNNVIKNCTIQNGTVGSSTITNFGIFVGLNTGAVEGPDNDNLTIQNNIIRQTTIGMQIIGGSTAGQQNDNLLIDNNIIGDDVVANSLGRIGMTVGQATNAMVNRNTIKNAVTTFVGFSSTNNATGIVISTGVTNSTFDANTIRDIKYTGTSGYGGKGIDINTGSATSNLTISNNMISNIMGDGWSSLTSDAIVGIRIQGTTGGVNIYHNTVNLGSGIFTGNTSGTQSAALFIGSTVTTLNIRNNIFVTNLNNTNAALAKSWAVNSAAPNTVFTAINYNDYSVSGGQGILGFLSVDQTTLAAWQTATAQDANSVNIAPVFTSATDLHLPDGSNGSLFDLGTPITGITKDIDNQDRYAIAPDMGADEFSPITLNLTAFIEGYYTAGTPPMRNVLELSGVIGATSTQCDTITVQLRNSTSPYAVVASFAGVLNRDGTLACKFPSDKQGGTYFVALQHRNALETWSGGGDGLSATSFSTVTTNYNFTTSADQAYGGNLKGMGGGGTAPFAIYSGDIDSDGEVLPADYVLWLISNTNGDIGYFATDLDGDGEVLPSDYVIWLVNNNLGVLISIP